MIKFLFVLSFLSFLPLAQANDLASPFVVDDPVVLDETLLPEMGDVEPFFGRRLAERDIASKKNEVPSEASEWQGQLSVLKEIPYSYPYMNSRSLANKVLSEIEESERSKEP